MHGDELNTLAQAVETTAEADAALVARVVDALQSAFAQPASRLAAEPDLLTSSEAALRVVDRMVPAWEISAKGVAFEPDGHWTCTIRESDSPDDLEVIGIGQASCLPRALIAALLRIAALRSAR